MSQVILQCSAPVVLLPETTQVATVLTEKVQVSLGSNEGPIQAVLTSSSGPVIQVQNTAPRILLTNQSVAKSIIGIPGPSGCGSLVSSDELPEGSVNLYKKALTGLITRAAGLITRIDYEDGTYKTIQRVMGRIASVTYHRSTDSLQYDVDRVDGLITSITVEYNP